MGDFMFDLHYDLLTYIYMNRNDLEIVKKHLKKLFNDNVSGGIFNLFYMSPKEMKEDLGIEKEEIDVIKNLEIVNNLIFKYNLLPNKLKYIYGIEGLDYLKKIEDIDKIYDLGVRSVNIVWNNDNKFGGGAKGDKNKGLTKLGEELIEKLADKKIAIDLSHTNEKTFYNIIDKCYKLKSSGKIPILFASHSNCYELCNHLRNLKDDQIIKINELGGVIGIVGVKPFCIKEEEFNNNKNKYYNAYIKHIKHVRDLLGGIESISISTDDMTYYNVNKKYYKHFNVFKQKSIRKELENLLLKNKFNKNDINKILYNNFNDKILQRL